MIEQQNQDSFHIAILENLGLNPHLEYEITRYVAYHSYLFWLFISNKSPWYVVR